mgnify:CR=1 FL=1
MIYTKGIRLRIKTHGLRYRSINNISLNNINKYFSLFIYMKIKFWIFLITAFLMANTYYDGKFTEINFPNEITEQEIKPTLVSMILEHS